MVWQVIFTVLAAFGALALSWALAGLLLPAPRLAAVYLVPSGQHADGAVARWRWLRSLGLLRGPLYVVGEAHGYPKTEDVEFCSLGALPGRLELEQKIDGTGNGNSPGRHQRRGISEL